jgi:TRAP-type mannitol/chloroaromatic compound transport system substrate-binding protein
MKHYGRSSMQVVECPTAEDIMKRRQFLKAAGIGLVGSAVAAPAIAQPMPELKWRLTSSFPKTLDALFGGAEDVHKAIAEATNNRFKSGVRRRRDCAGATGADAVTNGTVEACHTASYYYVGKDPTLPSAVRSVRPQQPDAERPGTCSAAGWS